MPGHNRHRTTATQTFIVVASLCDLVRDRHGIAHGHVELLDELGASQEHGFHVFVRRCTAN